MEYEILKMESEQSPPIHETQAPMYVCAYLCTKCMYRISMLLSVYMYDIKGGVSHIGCHIRTYIHIHICCYVFRALPHIPREENLSSTFNA